MITKEIRIEDFDYNLPDEKIAKHPLENREACKLLFRDSSGVITEHVFSELPGLLPLNSMLIYNNTRVINARLRFHKKATLGEGALIEIFCLEPASPRDYEQNFAMTDSCSWLCFVGNSKKWKEGELELPLSVEGKEIILKAKREEKIANASIVRFNWNNNQVTFAKIIEAAGEIPIPPYLNRNTEESDSRDYQTVYSHIDGSVAAPTAGLHFTDSLLKKISDLGIPRRELTLHVGAGTFQPVKSDNIGEHLMHSEFISVDKSLIQEIASTNRDVIAVGTTSVRTLESLYHIGCLIHEEKFSGEVPQWYPYNESHPDLSVKESLSKILAFLEGKSLDKLIASTRIIIAPGYKYRIVKGMVTNFHQPRSTLLLLVSAFVDGMWKEMYDYALEHNFRFLSYGDACLIFSKNNLSLQNI